MKEMDFDKIRREAIDAENSFILKVKAFGRKIWNKLCDLGRKLREVAYYILAKIAENPQSVVIAGAAILGSAKTINKISNDISDRRFREHTIWDNREHHRWPVRRQPTSQEWLEIHDMQAMGYSMGEALESIGLLRGSRRHSRR